MAWTYQNDVTFSGTAPETNSYGVPGGAGGTATQFYFMGAGVRYRRYTLSGNVLTFDTTWNTAASTLDTVLEVVGVDATRLWGFRDDRVLWFPLVINATSVTRDLALRIRLSRTAYMVSNGFDAAVSGTALFMVGTISGMTGTRLMRFDDRTAVSTVADNVLLTSSTGADIPSGGRRRVFTNGTHVWVVTFNSAGTNAKGYAFAHATLDRVSAQDFDLTFTANHNDATFDGTSFYFIRNDRSRLRKYSFVAATAPTGTVATQTATAGSPFEIDLSDHITGPPAPTFSIRNNSLTGTGLALSGTKLSGTPTRAQARAHTIEMTATNSAGSHDFSFTFNVQAAPAWSTIANREVRAGSAFSLDLANFVTGFPAPTVAIRTSTSLPSWLSLSGTTISGTPATTASAATVQFTATNSQGSAHVSFTITVVASAGWARDATFSFTNVISGANPRYIHTFNRAGFYYLWNANTFYEFSTSDVTGEVAPNRTGPTQTGDWHFCVSGNEILYLSRTTGSSTWFRSDFSETLGITNSERITGSPARLRDRADTAAWTGTKLYVLSSTANPASIQVYTFSGTGGNTVARTSAEDITRSNRLYSSSFRTGSARVFTDGTTIWVAGISSNSRQVFAEAYTISTRTRDPNRDFNITFTGGDAFTLPRRVFFDGSRIYTSLLAPSDPNGLSRYSYVALPNAAPTGTVSGQSTTAGTLFSLDLLDSISGEPTPTFSVRNDAEGNSSLTGTGLTLSGTSLSGTPTADNLGSYIILLRATNSEGSHDFSFGFTVNQAPMWSTIPNQTANVSGAFTLDLADYLTGFPTPAVTIRASTSLPSWLSLSGTTLSGTPTQTAAATTLQFTATNSQGTAHVSFTMTVGAAPVAPSGTVADQTAFTNSAFSLDLSDHITGSPAPTFTSRTSLPSWLTLTGTVLSGTPTMVAAATQIDLRATNSAGMHDFDFDLTVSAPVAVTWATIPNQTAYLSPSAQAQSTFSLDLVDFVGGMPAPTIAVTAGVSLPSWLSLTGTVLSGIVPTSVSGPFTLQFTGTNAAGSVNSNQFTLTLVRGSAPTGSPGAPPNLGIGRMLDHDLFGLSVAGNPRPSVRITSITLFTGSGPTDWISISNGRLVGTAPTVTVRTDYRVVLRYENAYGTRDLTLRVAVQSSVRAVWRDDDLVTMPFNRESFHAVQVGTLLNFDVRTMLVDPGIPPATLSLFTPLTGGNAHLASWLSFSGTILSGTPPPATYPTDRVVNLDFVATNAAGSISGRLVLSILQNAPTASTWSTIPNQTAYTDLPFRLDVLSFIGGEPRGRVTVNNDNPLPSWLTLAGTILSGTPTTAAGADTIGLRVENSVGGADTTFTVTVVQSKAPSITSTAITVDTIDIGEDFIYDVGQHVDDAGQPPATFAFADGFTPPAWLSLVGDDLSGALPDTGQLSAVPQRVPLVATNPVGSDTIAIIFNFQIPPTPRWVRQSLPDAGSGFPFTVDIADYFTGTPTPTVAVTAGTELPAGLTLTGTVLSVDNLPVVARDTTYQVSLTATNTIMSVQHDVVQALSLMVTVLGNFQPSYQPLRQVAGLGQTNFSTVLRVNDFVYHDLTVIRESVTPGPEPLASRTTGGVYIVRGFEFLPGSLNTSPGEGIYRYNHAGTSLDNTRAYHLGGGFIDDGNPYSIADDGTNLYVLMLTGSATGGVSNERNVTSRGVQRIVAADFTSAGRNTPYITPTLTENAHDVFATEDRFYVLDAATGEANAYMLTGARDVDRDVTFRGLTGGISGVAFDEVENDFIVADTSGGVFRRYSRSGQVSALTHSLTDLVIASLPTGTTSYVINGLAAHEGDIYVVYSHRVPRSGDFTQSWGIIGRDTPYFISIPAQIVNAANSFVGSLNLNDYVHDDSVVAFADGWTPPDGMTLMNNQWSYRPPAGPGRDASHTVYLKSTLRGRTSFATFFVAGAIAPPVWSVIPRQDEVAGVAISLDLTGFVTGSPPPVISFRSAPPSWLSIANGVLTGTPPIPLYRTQTDVSVALTATNQAGAGNTEVMVHTTLTLRIAAAPAGELPPTWTNIPVQTTGAGGLFSIDVSNYLTGFPVPTVALGAGSPTWLSITGTVISGTPPSRDFISEANVNVTLLASSTSGMAETILVIRVIPAGRLVHTSTIPPNTLNIPARLRPMTMTATATRIYVACVSSTAGSGRMLVYDWSGAVQSTEEFALPAIDSTSFGYSGLERVGERLYLLEMDFGVITSGVVRAQFIGRVHSYSLTGEAGTSFIVPHNTGIPSGIGTPRDPLGNPLPTSYTRQMRPTGLAHERNQFWIGTRRTNLSAWRMVPFNEEGVQLDITNEVILSGSVTLRGIAESDQHFYILGGGRQGTDVGRYSKTFVYQPDFDIDLHQDNDEPIGIGYGEGRIAVLDQRNGLFIYGSPLAAVVPPSVPQPEVPVTPQFPFVPTIIVTPGVAPPVAVSGYRQFEGMERWVSYVDVIRQTAQTTFQVLALGVEVIVQSAVSPRQFVLSPDVEITSLLHEVNIVPRYAIQGIENEDRLYIFTGTRSATAPNATGSYWIVKGISEVADGRHQEIYAEFESV